ncbi:hypothetical protein U472_00530 [Orenia metallireducens]|uniref:HD-GYP domain-containing protein n=1 Tax=Orenia metallireducens TaxID=1413210 RepID=A0A1C0AD82_9FIRM|nr:HD domain-containing phosphohydrolase [Orenia metallireducens]OCL28588.1 hypothetical protein U472_00530 [Orenia metallireducens]
MNRPKGLQKEEIFLLSRILRIVDTYDVMFYGRPYKPKLSQEEVFNKLETGSGSKMILILVRDL